jgi:hypothetical protein
LWRIIVRIVMVAHLILMRPPLKLAIAADGRPVSRGLTARPESDPTYQALIESFRTRLAQLGWTDGENLPDRRDRC